MAVGLPTPQSREQLLGSALASFMSRTGISDLNTGSIVTSLFETVAQLVFRSTGDIFQILRDYSLDRATGDSLARLALENGITPLAPTVTTGTVTISDTSFVKISTIIYVGTNAPNIGSTTIFVSDGSLFPSTGSVYLGRGSPNIEGPLPYSSVVQVGSFWQINLSSPTTKFHNKGESVVLAQGGTRAVPTGTVVSIPGTGSTADVLFSTTNSSFILDGETSVPNVPVAAQIPGSNGNAPIGAIKQFATPPFPGAAVSNPIKFSNGQDAETDDHLRARVRQLRFSIGLGTATAIETSVLYIQSTDGDTATVTSSDVVTTPGLTILYVDNGNGYEELDQGVGLEFIIDNAIGGESVFQLATGGRQAPVVKAYIETGVDAPWDVVGTDSIAVLVGGISSQHTFVTTDFLAPGAVTPDEVADSINKDSSLLFNARVVDNTSRIQLFAIAETNEQIQLSQSSSGGDAGIAMDFPVGEVDTLTLYKNRRTKLSRNGNTASIFTQIQSDWSNTIASGDTLILEVDNTQFITYTFTNADFIAQGQYTLVSAANSLASWVAVINAKVIGVTAQVSGSQIIISSNLGDSDRAAMIVDPSSTLVIKGMFSSTLSKLSSFGLTSDFLFDRNTAQIKLNKDLLAGESLSAGTEFTAAELLGNPILGSNLTFANEAFFWLLADDQNAQIINTGVVSNSRITVTKLGSNTISYTSDQVSAFNNVLIGDYVIIWSTQLAPGNRLEGRISFVSSTVIEMRITSAEYALASNQSSILWLDGLYVVRTQYVPQKFRVAPGTYNIFTLVTLLNNQTTMATFSIVDNDMIDITTNGLDIDGALLVVTQNADAAAMNLLKGKLVDSVVSQVAFIDSMQKDSNFPLFVNSTFSSEAYADPTDSYITSINTTPDLSVLFDPNEMISYLNPYGPILDAQPINDYTQMLNLSGNTVLLNNDNLLRRLRIADRFFVSRGFDFGYNDNIVAILDGNPTFSTFDIPLYRRAITNSTATISATSFNAYDVDAGSTTNFNQYFPNFNFANFKALMQARVVIIVAGPQNDILYRATQWGRSGEKINVGYVHPTSPSSPVLSTVTIDDNVNIAITLGSGPAVSTLIDGTTVWNLSIANNTPSAGLETLTYTYADGRQITTFSFGPDVTNSLNGTYFTIVSANNVNSYYGYFQTSGGSNIDPTPIGYVNINPGSPIAIPTNATALQVAAAVNAIINANGNFSSVNNFDNTITITNTINGAATDATVGTIPSPAFASTNRQGFNPGSSPGLTSVSAGDIVTIGPQTDFNPQNQGTFTVVTVTPTSFTVTNQNGTSFSQSQIPTLQANAITFYNSGTSTAADIVAYVNANLSDFITATLVNDSGTSGSGPITQSTEESSGFTTSSYFLVDGINWILSSNVAGSPEFIFKRNLQMPTSSGYSFNNGEEVRLIPTTIDQIRRLINVLAVTGYTTLGQIVAANRATQLELSTDTLGSGGQVQVVGGSGVSASATIISSAMVVADVYSSVVIPTTQMTGLHSDQWVYVSSANFQEKQTEIDDTVTAQNTANTPIVNQQTFVLGNRAPGMNFFGEPRKHVTQYGNTVKVEKQGELVCISLDTGSSLGFSSGPIPINDSAGGTVNIAVVNTTTSSYAIATGAVILSGVSIGDTVVVSGMVNAANNGTFPVTGVSSDYKIFEVTNPHAVTETSTAFTVGDFVFSAQVSEGDSVIIGAPFNPLNQGTFRVIRTYNNSFYINNSVTIVEERVTLSDNPLAIGSNNLTSYNVSIVSGRMRITWGGAGAQPTFAGARPGYRLILGTDFNTNNRGNFHVFTGTSTYIEVDNPNATVQSGVVITNIFEVYIPGMIFYPYEASIPGDSLVITNSVLGTLNNGTWTMLYVQDINTVVLSGTGQTIGVTSLGENFTDITVQEGIAYTGYKQIRLVSISSVTPNDAVVVFDNNNQYEKITQVAQTSMAAINNLEFSGLLVVGTDSYKYNTGLIAEANRVIYGDPTDGATYPGVAAAGVDVFVEGPLRKRVQVSIDIRVLTGVPFSQIVEAVRNTVVSIIALNPISQPIAISSIIAAVNDITGVQAIAINSPLYNASNDLIEVAPGEKTLVINPVTDIIVSRIGS